VIECVYATADFPAVTPQGARVMVRKGTHWPIDDPVVRANAACFSPDPRWGLAYSREPEGWDDPPVEQATAAPGERRQVRRAQHHSS
jgi:hypothetical protein